MPSNVLYSEIAELMAVKAKHSAGGEYSPDWRPNVIHPQSRYRPHDR